MTTTEIQTLLDTVREVWGAATSGPWTLVLHSPSGGTHAAYVRTPWGLPVASWGTRHITEPHPETLGRWATAEYCFHTSPDPDDLEHCEPCCDCGPYAESCKREEADLRAIAAAPLHIAQLCAAVEGLMEMEGFRAQQIAEMFDEQARLGAENINLREGLRLHRANWHAANACADGYEYSEDDRYADYCKDECGDGDAWASASSALIAWEKTQPPACPCAPGGRPRFSCPEHGVYSVRAGAKVEKEDG